MYWTFPSTKSSKFLYFFALSVFLFLMGGFIFLSFLLQQQIDRISQQRLSNRITTETVGIRVLVERVVGEYFDILNGARGLFAASQEVERGEWRDYAESLDIENNYPSVTALEYIKKVNLSDKESYEQSVRDDTSITPEGYPHFQVKSVGNQLEEDFFVVHFVQPLEGNEAAFGLELFSNPERRKALELARDTNQIVISEPLTLVQDDNRNEKSFLAVLPVYENGLAFELLDDRRKNIKGFVLLVIRANDLFSEVVEKNSLAVTNGFSVLDTSQGEKELISFIDSFGFYGDTVQKQGEKVRDVVINAGARTWKMSFYSDQKVAVDPVEEYFVFFFLSLGVIVSILVAVVLLNSIRLRTKAESIAKNLTKDLEKFRLAVASASDQIVITDADGIILYANEVVEKITGYTPQETLGTKAGKKWGGKMPADFYKNMWNTIKHEKKVFESEVHNVRKNGEQYIASVKISPVIDENGEVEFFVAIERDITKEKEVDRMKTEFISLASHQLRTPLTAIRWFVEMMQSGDAGELDQTQREFVDKIWLSTRRMIDLVNGLLNISRIESGRIIIDPVDTQIKDIISTVIADATSVLKDKNQTVTVQAEGIPIIKLDPKLIGNAVMNFVTNACKYSPENTEIRVLVAVENEYLKVSVVDSGIGIPENQQSKVFTKFFRADNAIHTEAEGTGLGLYLAKSIIEASGGRVGFESEQGKGTTFWFTLPISGVQPKAGEVSLQENEK